MKHFTNSGLGLKMNNMSPKCVQLRNVFLDSEVDYLEELRRTPSFLQDVSRLQSKFNAKELNLIAETIMDEIECCKVRPEDLERSEYAMICALFAIVDIEHINEHYELYDEPEMSR